MTTTAAFSQPSKGSYTIWECINIAQKNSPAAEAVKSSYKEQKKNYEAYQASLLPQLNFNGSLPGLNRTIRTFPLGGNDVFLPQSQLSSFANFGITQKIPFTGAELNVRSGLSRIDILETNESLVWRSTPINISLSQPIFRFNPMHWNTEENELMRESADREYVEDLEDIAIDITRKFFELYIQKMQVENAKKNVAVNDTLYQLAQGRFKVGKIAENDLLQSELALSNKKIELENAELEYRRTMEELLRAMGMEDSDEIEVIPPYELPDFNVSVEKALAQAKQNRSDRINYELNKLRAERELARTKDNNNFGAALTAGFGYNQSAGNMPEVYHELLDQETLNLSLSMPIFQWGMGSAEVEAALARQQQVKSSIERSKYQFDLEVKYLALRFKQLQKQVAVAAKADTIAARRFEVAKNRYMIGKIDLNSLFIAQNEKDSALQNYIRTLQNYWVSYFRLRRLTLYDFENNRALIEK